MIDGNPFIEIAAILGLATLFGVIGRKLRQPLIIMFLATGIIAGPTFLGIIQSHEQIELLAEIAITGDSSIKGYTLEELQFRQTYGATVIGIRRGEENITTINPAIELQEDDSLIIVGKAETVEELKEGTF